MADISREVFLREDQPAICAHWHAEHWRLFHQKLEQLGKGGGMLTGTAVRFVAKAVNQEMPEVIADPAQDQHATKRKVGRAVSSSKRGAKKMHEPVLVDHSTTEPALTLHVPPLPTTPTIDDYLAEIRRKFETLLKSKHRGSVSAFVEVLYRDVVFLEGHDQGG